MVGPSQPNATDTSSIEGIELLIVSLARLLRDGIATILQQHAAVTAVQTAENAELAIAALAQFTPTLILLDVATEDGLSVARRLSEAAAGIQMLSFAARAHDHDLLAYASAGITGFVPREASTEDLCAAVERAVRGEFLCSPPIAATLFRQLATLSHRRGLQAIDFMDV